MLKHRVITVLYLLSCTLLFVGCRSISENKTTNNSGLTHALDRTVYTSIRKGEGPTIVFESGQNDSMITWLSIFEQISKVTSVFAYNRPGIGGSANDNELKSVSDLSKRLKQILTKAGHQPPYILVGHSEGAIFINFFARLYPEEVSGVFFIDPSHPEQYKFSGNDLRSQQHKRIISNDGVMKRKLYKEYRKLDKFPNIPLTILTSGDGANYYDWLESHQKLARLSDKSEHHVIKNSRHYIHKDQPKKVLNHLLALIARVND